MTAYLITAICFSHTCSSVQMGIYLEFFFQCSEKRSAIVEVLTALNEPVLQETVQS